MSAPHAVATYALNGTLKDFTIPFEYLARKFVVVTLLSGSERRVLIPNTDYRFVNSSQLVTTVAWGRANGFDSIEVRRVTSATNRLVEFSDGSILRAYDLNTSQIQAVHIAEEARDLTTLGIGLDQLTLTALAVAKFLGPRATHPIERNDGTDLQEGDRYENTTEHVEYVFRAGVWSVNNLNGALLATPEGSSFVGHRTALYSSVARVLRDRLDDAISVKDFGARGDGILRPLSAIYPTLADAQAMYPFVTSLTQSLDWAAFTAAGQTGRSVLVPFGKYRLNDTVLRDHGYFMGVGLQSEVVFVNMAGKNGFEFKPTVKQTTSGCKSMGIYALGSDGGSAIKTPYEAIQYTQLRSSFQMEDLLLAGYTSPSEGTNNAFETIETWLCGLELGDASNVGVREVDCYGSYRSDSDPAPQVKSVFLRLHAQSAMLTAQISSLTAANVYRGIEIGDKVFFQISSFDIAHVFDGIYQTGMSPYGESKIFHGNINAQHYGIYFNGIGSREINGTVIRRHRYGWKGATHDFVGIRLNDCNYVWVTDCQVQPDSTGGDFAGTAYGIQAILCGGLVIKGFVVGLNLHRGILLDNCVMVQVSGTASFQAHDYEILFRLINNTRNSQLGEYKLVSSFVGTVYSDDGSIGATVQFFGRDIQPCGSTPVYYLRRATSAVDEKIWKLTSGATTFAIQATNDADTSNVNALILTRIGLITSTFDIRATTTITVHLRPGADAARNFGEAGFRWNNSFFAVAPTVSSDARTKQQDRPLDEAERAVAVKAKGLLKVYKLNNAVDLKGPDDARWHFGIYAQELVEAFTSEGLNANDYAMLCHDTWEARDAVFDDQGNETSPAVEAGELYGIRYEQLLAFIISST